MRQLLALILLPVLLPGFLPMVGGGHTTFQDTTDTTSGPSGRLVLVLDSSGSMREPAATGGTKIDAARRALKEVVRKLPDKAQVGMRVFGATVENAGDEGACTDTQNVVPVGPLDRAGLTKAIGSYHPWGETPIGNALKGAATDLGPAVAGQKRTIVLLSDGEPTCAPDPCRVARQLHRQGVDLKVNVVGLSVSGKARSALQCIARQGGGSYTDANDAGELSSSLVSVSVRAMREFTISGTPVTGGASMATAEPIEPGQYTDAVPRQGEDRYYLVDVPKGGRIAASVTARPALDGTTQTLSTVLMTPMGEECDPPTDFNNNVLKTRTIITSSTTYDPHTFSDNEPCSTATQYVVRVAWEGALHNVRYELLVDVFPPAANYDSLPAGVADTDPYERPVRAHGRGTPVVGGASFDDAPVLTPGTYRDTIRPGEQLLYRIPVGWGQSARATTTVQRMPSGRPVGMTYAQNRMITPMRAKTAKYYNGDTGVEVGVIYDGSEPKTMTTLTPPVRLKNADLNDYEVDPSWYAGDYYLSIEMGQTLGNSSQSWAAPLTIAVAVDGTVSGEPDYPGGIVGADAVKKVAPHATAPSSGHGGSGLPWAWAGAGLGAILLLGAGFVLGRRWA